MAGPQSNRTAITHDLSILPGQPTAREIVGVVGSVRTFGLDQPLEGQVYIPHQQMPWPSMAIAIRTTSDPQLLGRAIREAIWKVDATIPVPPIRPLDRIVADASGQPRFRTWLLSLFAGAAVLLSLIGLYGTMAYVVQQRSREIGLRLALGATPAQVSGLLLRTGLKVVVTGIGIGVAGAMAASRLLGSLLFGISPIDPATFLALPLALLIVGGIACYLPTRRTRAIDPIRTLNANT